MFGGALFSAMHGSLVTSSLVRETSEEMSQSMVTSSVKKKRPTTSLPLMVTLVASSSNMLPSTTHVHFTSS